MLYTVQWQLGYYKQQYVLHSYVLNSGNEMQTIITTATIICLYSNEIFATQQRLFLHIGPHKTASTFIQSVLVSEVGIITVYCNTVLIITNITTLYSPRLPYLRNITYFYPQRRP